MLRKHQKGAHWGRRHAAALAMVLALVAVTGFARALEAPRPGELERLRAEGSLPARLDFAERLGNGEVDPDLVQAFKHRVLGLKTPPPARRGMPTKGDVRIFALLIDFQDHPHTVSPATVDDMLFGAGNPLNYPRESLAMWYRRSSVHQLDLSHGMTLGWYTTPYDRSQVVETDQGRDNVIKEALTAMDASVDFSQFDNDGDGDIDYFVVMWTGPVGSWASFWWGYQTHFKDPSFTLDGKKLSKYSWQWELDNPRVVIHETGHALGLPDLYDYDGSVGPRGGVGAFDEMDSNEFDHNGFSKWLLDWQTPTFVNGDIEDLVLYPAALGGGAVVVWPASGPVDPFSEFFLVENRGAEANDMHGWFDPEGLAVWHIDAHLDDKGLNFRNNNSYTPHKLVRLMEADGKEHIEKGWSAAADDLYGDGERISHVTFPSTRAYSGDDSCATVCDVRTLPSGQREASYSAKCSVPPFADAGGPYVVECTSDQTDVPLDGTGTNDSDIGESRDYQWTSNCPGGSFDDAASETPDLSVATTTAPVECAATLEVTDCAGNTADATAAVSIQDTLAPDLVVHDPDPQNMIPSQLPFNVFFESNDLCGVVHEVVLFDGCPVFDGETYGDGDGLLADETLVVDDATLCAIAAQCGVFEWYDPEVVIEVTDKGGNLTTASRTVPGGYQAVGCL